MKRLFTILLVLAMISMVVLTCYASEVIKENDCLYVEYEEFYGNREKYDELILKGVTIFVNVGEEHAAEEIARFTTSATTVHELSPAVTRGTSSPTSDYHIHNGTYTFNCDADYSYLYTDYKFYGCEVYLISGFNVHNTNQLRIRVYGTSSGTVDFSIPAGTTIYKTVATHNPDQRWYPLFFPPSYAYGDINCVAH